MPDQPIIGINRDRADGRQDSQDATSKSKYYANSRSTIEPAFSQDCPGTNDANDNRLDLSAKTYNRRDLHH